EGVNRLPEAAEDRFIFKVNAGQEGVENLKIIGQRRMARERAKLTGITPKHLTVEKVAEKKDIAKMFLTALSVHLSPEIEDYIMRLSVAPDPHQEDADPEINAIKKEVRDYVYTRVSQDLQIAARVHAVYEGRTYVSAEDIEAVAPMVLRLRLKPRMD